MSISAYMMDHPTITHLRHRKDGLAELGPIQMYCLVTPDTATLDFVGPHYEPTLRLKGQVSGMQVTEADRHKAALYGIDTVDFDSGEKYDGRPRMVCDYKFSRDQIKEMVDKGLYERDFTPPTELFTSEQWMIPTEVEFYVSQPEREDEPAVLLCEIQSLRETQMTLDNSGYDLVEYFPNLIAERELNAAYEHQHEHAGLLAGKDMFADYSFGDEEQDLTPAQRREKDEVEHAHERVHKQLPYLAGEETLEFTEEFENAFPTDDHIPDEVVKAREELDKSIAERENDAVLTKFEDIRKNEGRAFAEARMGLTADIEDELDDEDYGDLFAEEDEVEAEPETVQPDSIDTEATDLEQEQAAEAALVQEEQERSPRVEVDAENDFGDMFADEDFGDDGQEDTRETDQLSEEEEQARRLRRRRAQQSQRLAEMSEPEPSQTQPAQTPSRPETDTPKRKDRDKDLGPELG